MVSKTLLTITARGNAIITELNRLYELVPSVFLNNAHDQPVAQQQQQQQQQQKYLIVDGRSEKKFTINDIICDFSYFKIQESFEAKIDSSEALKRADEEFCNNYIDILTRFYLTFESVQRYSSDLNNFVQEIQDNLHVGQSFDSMLSDIENRQLLCESYYLLGYMLLTIDNYFESSLREKIIVSYFRYSSYKSSPGSNLDDTCNLMRSTGYLKTSSQLYSSTCCGTSGGKQQQQPMQQQQHRKYHRPEGYPESFFARVGVNTSLVSLLVSKLLSVDIYNQTVVAFPHPDHRSTALATQASMLYVILFFCPNILHNQRSKMREITDKFFYDNWMTSIYMGDLVNLIEAWNPYKAARESLIQLLELESTRALAEQFRSKFDRASRQLRDYLKEGWLDEDRVLEHHARILTLVRESNVILRWFMLHSYIESDWQLRLTRSLHSLVSEIKPNDEDLYLFLQNLAELERKFLVFHEGLLAKQVTMISESQLRAVETIDELIAIFSDPKPMRYIQPGSHTKLASHLQELATNLRASNCNSEAAATTTTAPMRDVIISSINQVTLLQDQYSDGKNLQVVQLFSEVKDSLLQVLHSLSLSKDIRIILHSIGDFGYAWKTLPQLFAPQMQRIIKNNPMRIHEIGATFLKLASAFDASLIRIQQVDSRLDLMSVGKYYSSKLMSHIRDVLHVIPETILELLSSVIEIQTECTMGELPSRISLDKLRDYALPDKRFKMLELIYKVSHYAESLMLMQNTIIGVIEVDSRKLLEDGIRRELVRRMSDSIHKILYPPSKVSSERKYSSGQHLASSLLKRLARLDEVMGGFKRSLEYVQDYLFIYGLRMWQEELRRIVRFNVDMATSVLRGKSYLNQHHHHHHHHQQQVDNQSSTQSAGQQHQRQSGKIPVPVYHSNPLKSSFIVLILDELLQITDPRSSIYDEQMSAWLTISTSTNTNNSNSSNHKQQTHDRLLDLKVFQLIGSSLGIVGLNGFDELCSCLLMFELQRLDDLLISICCTGQDAHLLLESLDALAKLPSNSTTNYVTTASGSSSSSSSRQIYGHMLKLMAPHSEQIVSHLSSIGQLQLIRMSIGSVLSTRSRCEARNIYNCLETLNSSSLATLKQQQSGRLSASSSSSSQHKNIIQNQGNNNFSKQQQQQSTTTAIGNNNRAKITTSNVVGDIGIMSNQNEEEEEDLCDRLLNNNNNNSSNCNNDDDDNEMINGESFGRAIDLDDSQLIFELTNHLEWIGLSDPLSKIYTLSLQSSDSSQIYEFRQKFLSIDLIKFLLLLEHCSLGTKFLFSKSISDFLPVPSTADSSKLHPTQSTIDGGPLIYGIITLLNHYRPFLS